MITDEQLFWYAPLLIRYYDTLRQRAEATQNEQMRQDLTDYDALLRDRVARSRKKIWVANQFFWLGSYNFSGNHSEDFLIKSFPPEISKRQKLTKLFFNKLFNGEEPTEVGRHFQPQQILDPIMGAPVCLKGIDILKVFPSSVHPALLALSFESHIPPAKVIIKNGDDLMGDLLVEIMFTFFTAVWKNSKLLSHRTPRQFCYTYTIAPSSEKCGFIEFVDGGVPFSKIDFTNFLDGLSEEQLPTFLASFAGGLVAGYFLSFFLFLFFFLSFFYYVFIFKIIAIYRGIDNKR